MFGNAAANMILYSPLSIVQNESFFFFKPFSLAVIADLWESCREVLGTLHPFLPKGTFYVIVVIEVGSNM